MLGLFITVKIHHLIFLLSQWTWKDKTLILQNNQQGFDFDCQWKNIYIYIKEVFITKFDVLLLFMFFLCMCMERNFFLIMSKLAWFDTMPFYHGELFHSQECFSLLFMGSPPWQKKFYFSPWILFFLPRGPRTPLIKS